MKSLKQHIQESIQIDESKNLVNIDDVKVGDKGVDYNDTKGEVLGAYKNLEELKKSKHKNYANEVESWIKDDIMDKNDPIVIVKSEGETVPFGYGYEGFYIEK